jgi:hypothetical protein
MISAMYENGGNVTQRLLDGHPALFSYPFESQLGSRYVRDHLTSLYPQKYCWPVFPLDSTAADDYEAIIDEECKVRIKTPQASKFRDRAVDLDDGDRKRRFLQLLEGRPRTRAALVQAFFEATAAAWKDARRSGAETVHVGYSPIVGVDAGRMLADSPAFFLLNVVRNPWSAYADTLKRPVPLSLAHYVIGWCVHQQHALSFAERHPDRVFVVRYEDLVADPARTLSGVLARLGLGSSATLATPSWNGAPLDQVYPWGTIRQPTPAANEAARRSLPTAVAAEIRSLTAPFLARLGYE